MDWRTTVWLGVVIALLQAGAAAVARAEPITSPKLLLTPDRAAEMRALVGREPWAQALLQRIREDVDAAVNAPVALPPRPGNWGHFYVCREHGCDLVTGREIAPLAWEHVCPIGREIFKTDPSQAATDYDAMVYTRIHRDNARRMLHAGIVYQATGEARYAAFVRAMALAYADRAQAFAADPRLHDANLPGVIQWAGLDEAVWQVPTVQALDCVWATFSDVDRATIADQLLRPSARLLMGQLRGIGNHQCWKNAAVGLIGLLLDDREMIALAIDHPNSGFHAQLKHGLSVDGQWFEGSWGYHVYTMNALWPLAVAGENAGLGTMTDVYRRAFDGPIAHAQPNLLLPMFNDGWQDAVPKIQYPIAWSRWRDPRYAAVLQDVLKDKHIPILALIFGLPDASVDAKTIDWHVGPLPSGYTILRSGSGRDATWLSLKYAAHGGGHGHPDKNHFILYARGQVLMPDFGSINYASPLTAQWARATLSHNTLVVDGQSQKPAEGKLLAHGIGLADGRVQFASGDAGPIAPGVRFVRTLVLIDQHTLIGIDRVTSDVEHVYDLALHYRGRWIDKDEAWGDWKPTDDAAPPYRQLRGAEHRAIDQPTRLQVAPPGADWTTHVLIAPTEPTELIRAAGPDRDVVGEVPVLIQRRRAKSTTFVWAVGIGRTVDVEVAVEGIEVELAVDGLRLRADRADGELKVVE